jgi:hypothetical protein
MKSRVQSAQSRRAYRAAERETIGSNRAG